MIYEFSPKQDLHGYDKPWAPGAGKNILPFAEKKTKTTSGLTIVSHGDGTFTVSGTTTGPVNMEFLLVDTIEFPTSIGQGGNGCLYMGNSFAEASNVGLNIYFSDNTKATWGATVANRVSYAYPDADGAGKTITGIGLYVGIGKTLNGTFAPMITNDGTYDETKYIPWANICPPIGYNIWDPTNQEYVQVYAGYVNANTRELYLRPVYKEYAGEELVGPWMSSLDPYEEDTTPTEGAFVIDFGGELNSYEITPFMLQTLLDSLGIRQHFTDGAGLLNSLMDQAQGRVRSEEELLHLSRPLKVIAIGDQLPAGLTFKPISKDVLPGLPGKFIR